MCGRLGLLLVLLSATGLLVVLLLRVLLLSLPQSYLVALMVELLFN